MFAAKNTAWVPNPADTEAPIWTYVFPSVSVTTTYGGVEPADDREVQVSGGLQRPERVRYGAEASVDEQAAPLDERDRLRSAGVRARPRVGAGTGRRHGVGAGLGAAAAIDRNGDVVHALRQVRHGRRDPIDAGPHRVGDRHRADRNEHRSNRGHAGLETARERTERTLDLDLLRDAGVATIGHDALDLDAARWVDARDEER
jgi:hypothetical protein